MLPPHEREQLNGAVVLPSLFLREMVPGLQVRSAVPHGWAVLFTYLMMKGVSHPHPAS